MYQKLINALKTENVLMDIKGYVSLADFGMAKYIKPEEDELSLGGTPEYLGTTYYYIFMNFNKSS